MRMIDADALWEIFREKQNSLTARCGGYRFLDGEDRAKYGRLAITLAYIENAPEVDAVPVVRGEWIEDGDMQICSNCGEEHSWEEYRASYCEDCGAKMESEGGT